MPGEPPRAAVQAAGGPDVAQGNCQILPPHFPGYRPDCPYSAGTSADGGWKAPDLARAHQLIAAAGTRGMKVTLWVPSFTRGLGTYTAGLLRTLGYPTTLKVVEPAKYFPTVFDSRSKVQYGLAPLDLSDYPAASGFFMPILTCASFMPESAGNLNGAEFCDPRIDRDALRATSLQASEPQAASRLWNVWIARPSTRHRGCRW